MYFKLMNGRETYLEGMRELLEERHHQVISEDAGDSQGETAQAAFLYHNSGKSR